MLNNLFFNFYAEFSFLTNKVEVHMIILKKKLIISLTVVCN